MIIYCIVLLSPFYCKMNVLPLGQTIIFLLLNSFLLFFLSCFLWASYVMEIDEWRNSFSLHLLSIMFLYLLLQCYSVSSLKDRSHNFITPVDNVLNQVSMMCLTLIKCLWLCPCWWRDLPFIWVLIAFLIMYLLNVDLCPYLCLADDVTPIIWVLVIYLPKSYYYSMLTFILPVPSWWRALLFEYWSC